MVVALARHFERVVFSLSATFALCRQTSMEVKSQPCFSGLDRGFFRVRHNCLVPQLTAGLQVPGEDKLSNY